MLASVTPKKAYTFLIDPELDEGLKALKARDGMPAGEAIRRALAAFLNRKGIAIGEAKSGRPRAATRKRP
jgi:hypothetical protein